VVALSTDAHLVILTDCAITQRLGQYVSALPYYDEFVDKSCIMDIWWSITLKI